MSGLPPLFPGTLSITEMDKGEWKENKNPAMRLFGKRFFIDQRAMDLLVEFLAVALAEKKIAAEGEKTGRTPLWNADALPPLSDLRSWPAAAALFYRLPVYLNLKLFAFFRLTPPDKRHPVHEEQYRELGRRLREKPGLAEGGKVDKAVEILKQLLGGLQGAGFDRVWSARTFYPLAPALLMQETLFNFSTAKSKKVNGWEDIIDYFNIYFSVSKHRFLARGGELLYLQLCNLFRTDPDVFATWLAEWRALMILRPEEADMEKLHENLSRELKKLGEGRVSRILHKLADYIENLDPATSRKVTEKVSKSELKCEYCAAETWPETYLFAVELYRLLQAALDPAERLDMLMLLCVLQVLRTLCAQSARYGGREGQTVSLSNPLGYAWLFTPGRASPALRLAAAGNLQVVQTMIYTALRHPALKQYVQRAVKEVMGKKDEEALKKEENKLWREADDKYGYKLLLSLGKQSGIIVPRTGPGARFVLGERLLRLLVLTVLPPGQRCTYPEFLQQVYLHFGIALEGRQLLEALRFTGQFVGHDFAGQDKDWPVAMLRAAGFLEELSDAFSLVVNPF
ncbi:hypothetical protein [Desulforamulus putei]|uniref:hypothetical protein n=1 Tax=Desulforamulus putei TaxID=74701 RepID=UPI002FDCE959